MFLETTSLGEVKRKLASIEVIANLRPHPNADRLEIAEIKGWDVVVQKDLHQAGNKVVYFEIDSFLPVEERYEWLRKSSFRSTSWQGEGFRIKTIKLRGEVSQGMIMPLNDFPDVTDHFDDHLLYPGFDLTEWLNIKKYDPPLGGVSLGGNAKGLFPSFIPKTDEERFQNLTFKEKELYGNDTFEVSIKMDGSSFTAYSLEGEVFGVCSRNLELQEDDPNNFRELGDSENLFWKMARKYNLKELLKGWNLAIQAEMCGPGIQHNRSKLQEHKLFVFNIYNMNTKCYCTPTERKNLLYDFTELPEAQILDKNAPFPTKEELVKLTTETKFNGQPIEGVVFKSNEHPGFSFKFINPDYLIKNDE